MLKFVTTKDIPVPQKLIDQIIGQEKAVDIIKKAARQKRHVLLIGLPGTGKSMLAQAMAELMPVETLEDVLAYPNPNNENQPLIRSVRTYPDLQYLKQNKQFLEFYTPQEHLVIKQYSDSNRAAELPKILRIGLGRRIVNYKKAREDMPVGSGGFLFLLIGLILVTVIFVVPVSENVKWFIIAAVLGLGFLYVISNATAGLSRRFAPTDLIPPKLIVDNTEKTTAPFVDATGSRAGALLGDCKHDPLQCFFPLSTTTIVRNGQKFTIKISDLVQELLEKYPSLVQTDNHYEGLILPNQENIYTLGFVDGQNKLVRIRCVNRRLHKGKIRIVNQNNSRLLVTPEHKIFIDGDYIESQFFDGKQKLITNTNQIITKDDVIKTFSEQDQKDALNYYKFVQIKKDNPKFGYKKIAKILGIKPGQTRWWNNSTYKPKAVQTVERLEAKGLLPFFSTNPNAPAISRILGTTFGDGGVFSTMNGIFLSSSEEDSLRDYAQDMISIFGEEIGKNFERRISGINNTGMCIWNTNRDVVRFFSALGAPLGRKNKDVFIPAWVHSSKEVEKEFFGAYLGNELCSPKFSSQQNKIQYFGFGLAGRYNLKENRLKLLKELSDYLASYGIKTSPHINENEFRKGSFVWRLGISTEIENLLRFYELISIRYSNAKVERIRVAIAQTIERKKSKYDDMLNRNKTDKYINSTLRVSGTSLQKIISREKLDFDQQYIEFSDYVYNITTESGNLFANGILVSNSGGLGTPAHLRVEAGAIHRSNKGVLFVDEIASLKLNWQQELLTAMQEKRYSITGQSEMSSGALVKTEPVPSDFVLVAAGNLPDMQQLHPALRSRIRGGGYEVYVEDNIEDNEQNQDKIFQFIAQEVTKDGKIPHFSFEAAKEILEQARHFSGRRKKLTLNLRELGGLVRAAGDIAKEKGSTVVEVEHIAAAKKIFNSIESQLGKKMIDVKKEYQTLLTIGAKIGRVNGLAVLGDSMSGIVLPLVAEVTPPASKQEGKVIATGKLGTIAKEAVENVSAIVKKCIGVEIARKDIHVQFLQTYEGVEGDSASISIAVAVLSALADIPVNQQVAMTGSLDVRGNVLPIGGVNAKIDAAIESGLKKVIIPESNGQDVYLSKQNEGKIEIVRAKTIVEVLEHALEDGPKKKTLLAKMGKMSS